MRARPSQPGQVPQTRQVDRVEPVEVEALVVAGRIDRLLDLTRAAPSISTRRWLVDALERALLHADPGAVTEAQRDAARALGADAQVVAVAETAPPPHAVLVPFAPLAGEAGFVRSVHVTWSATDGDDGLSEASREAVRRALTLAAERTGGRPDVSRYRLVPGQAAVTGALRVFGGSLGAAAFVSAVAAWGERRVRPGTVVTGELTATGVSSVGGLAAKLDGVLAGRPDARRLVVPSRNAASVRAAVRGAGADVEVVGVGTLESLLEATLEDRVERALRPEDAVRRARRDFERGWQGYRWPSQREPLERLVGEVPHRRPELRVESLVMLGAVTRHLGAPDESLAILEEAMRIAQSDEGREAVPDLPLTELHQHLALTLRQLCRFGDASRSATRAVAVARRGRLRGELLKAHGCAGLVQLSRNRADLAVRHQRAALDIVHRHRPESCPRTHGYLVEALGAAGEIDAARREYRRALAHLELDGGRPGRASREAWLRTSWATALSAGQRWREVRRVLETDVVLQAIATDPLPGLLARRWLGLARAAGRDPDDGFELLAESVAAHGRGLRPHVRFLAHLNVLFEAQARLARGRLDTDARQRARTALAHLPTYGDATRFLGRPARAVAEALDGSATDERLGRPLAQLLSRCQRAG